MKHTQGKWEVKQADSKKVVVCGNMVIASDLYDENEEPSIEELDANANLIASAPELLTACKYALGVLESIPEVYAEQIADILDENIDVAMIEKTITKAEGRGKNKMNKGTK